MDASTHPAFPLTETAIDALVPIRDHGIISAPCGAFLPCICRLDGKETLFAAQSAMEHKPIRKNAIVTLGTVVALTAGLARAQVPVEDTDGKSSCSMEELIVASPELTAAQDAQILVAG